MKPSALLPAKPISAAGEPASADLWLRRASIALGVIGLIVAAYLVYIKYNPSSALCTNAGDCEAVNASRWSEINGIPVAAFGAAAYLFLLGVLLFENRHALLQSWGPLAVFGAALAGTLYSGYLTYIEIAVIHKICPYCVTSAVVMTLIFILSIPRLRRYLT
jgi:uncharacterized membrane protein